jgi:Fur family ferric uptake transcriptional regulator
MPANDATTEALRGAGLRITAARRAIAALIEGRRGHFTAEDVLNDAAKAGQDVGRATVFRSLETLSRLGLVERVDLPSGEHAYVACRPDEHHHHVVCSRCGRSEEVADIGLAPVLARVAEASGFRIDSHRLELFGVCADCRAQDR